jgi:hypothetical protein
MIDGFKIVYGSEKPAIEEAKRAFGFIPRQYMSDQNGKVDYKKCLNEAI